MGSINKLRPQNREDYLANLPPEVYDKSRSSHLIRLFDATCGNAGIGAARNNLMLKRLQTNIHETYYNDLDELYGGVFDFRRLATEAYSYDPKIQLLTVDQLEEIQHKDDRYRARIHKYMLAYQYGGTPHGIRLAAESACGKECKVLEAWRYYEALNLGENQQISITPGNYSHSNHNEYIVVVNHDELTEAERYNINKYTKRIKPQDAVITVKTRLDFLDELVFETQKEKALESVSVVDASSHFWQVKKYVTGRPDWEYDVDNDLNLWVSPNERREAPTQSLVTHQEELLDFTYIINDIKASTEHIGKFDTDHLAAFTSLRASDRTELQKASNALSDVSNRIYSASYFGAEGVVDWAYPLQYTPAIQSIFSEDARSSRYWSSDERLAEEQPYEWLEMRFQKSIPLNRIDFEISRKPVRVIPYILVDPDNDVWIQPTNKDHVKLEYVHYSWGGNTLAGDMIKVSFNCNMGIAYGLRFEFERLTTRFFKTTSSGSLKQVDFPFSVDISNVSIHHDIKTKQDFIATSYSDIFGNKVDTELFERKPELVLDKTSDSYWMSKPNIRQSAIEYIVFDVKQDGKAARIEWMDIDAVFGGAQMNVYSTEDSDYETASWKPYSSVYELMTVRYHLPARKCTFIKLEFTGLNSIPYTIVDDNIPVTEIEFPNDITTYFNNLPASTYAKELWKQLLSVQDDPVYENTLGVYNAVGTEAAYEEVNKIRDIEDALSDTGNALYLPSLVTPDSYRFTDNGAISGVLGQNMRYERPLPMADREPVEAARIKMRFFEEGQHNYKKAIKDRKNEIAYVVGLREVSFGSYGVEAGIDPKSDFILLASNTAMITENTGWDLIQEERMMPATEHVNQLETKDFYNAVAFKTFEFASSQKPAVEQFDYPSDMSNEWHAFDGATAEADEFGVSGTVLKLEGDGDEKYGIYSDAKLVRSQSIATIQLDMFCNTESTWYFRCKDLSGEEVFNMKYEVEAGKWTTIGNIFTPQVGGMWWSNAYDYRVRIPVTGFLPRGATLFVPNIDFDTLRDQSSPMVRDDLKDFKLIYYNGVDNREIDCDITDSMELWFRIQDEIPSGVSADGYYDYERDEFIGAYYLYFGNSSEQREPLRDYHQVFKPVDEPCYKMTVADPRATIEYDEGTGVLLDAEDTYLEIDDHFRIDSGAGFITFEVTPTEDLQRVPEGTLGRAQERYYVDYHDESRRLSVFTYEEQLFVRIYEKDGFRNSFVTHAPFKAGQKSYVLIQWGAQGTADVQVSPGEVDEGNLSRRFMDVWIDGTQCENINNFYNEINYNDGKY